MILTEPNTGAQYELRSWLFPLDQLSHAFYTAVGRQMERREGRTHGVGLYRHRETNTNKHYVSLIGRAGAIDQIRRLPKPIGGREVELVEGALIEALLNRRLRSEAEVALDMLDGKIPPGWVERNESYGHKGVHISRTGEVLR